MHHPPHVVGRPFDPLDPWVTRTFCMIEAIISDLSKQQQQQRAQFSHGTSRYLFVHPKLLKINFNNEFYTFILSSAYLGLDKPAGPGPQKSEQQQEAQLLHFMLS